MPEIAWADYVEMRFYTVGWTIRIGMLIVRFHKQQSYTSFSIEKLRADHVQVGGMSWKEFRLHRQQVREASAVARAGQGQ